MSDEEKAIIRAALEIYRNKPKDLNEGDVYFTDFVSLLSACEELWNSRKEEKIPQICGRCGQYGCYDDRKITMEDVIEEYCL